MKVRPKKKSNAETLIADLNGQLQQLKEKVKSQEKEIVNLRQDLGASEKTRAETTKKNIDLGKDVEKHKIQLDGARAHYRRLEQENFKKTKEIDELTRSIEQLKAAQQRELEKQRSTLMSQANDWRTSVEDVQPLKK